MKLRTFFTLTDGVYKASMRTEDWSQLDGELIAKYGEPEIDLGGVFTGPPLYTLPANLARIMTESPFTQSADSSDYADADDRTNVWAAAIDTRITAALVTLRANTDAFTRETVEEL